MRVRITFIEKGPKTPVEAAHQMRDMMTKIVTHMTNEYFNVLIEDLKQGKPGTMRYFIGRNFSQKFYDLCEHMLLSSVSSMYNPENVAIEEVSDGEKGGVEILDGENDHFDPIAITNHMVADSEYWSGPDDEEGSGPNHDITIAHHIVSRYRQQNEKPFEGWSPNEIAIDFMKFCAAVFTATHIEAENWDLDEVISEFVDEEDETGETE